ncbi:putative general negative regulator of transcription subunit [Triangularia verruculosa]|uniref:General negative regulator of transcription subunit n=1 Tax=Triangularia verruculosa TaxID=2587418 RepID=A0AAN6XAW4_9PEZI|nr:putative general negative regulator of transcription subunit [Triangularia verruculosa]
MMNRQGPLRQLPYGQQPPQQQSGRPVVSRGLPKGQQAAMNNSSNWGFSSNGLSMGGNANLGQGMRPLPGGNNMSFAQTLGSSQQQHSGPLDPSEFPSLSNAAPNQSTQASMWAQQPSRNIGGGAHRGPQTPLSAHPGQDDLFAPSRLATAQSSFRFGNQGAVNQAPQGGQADEFPPLNRPTNGEIGQERGSGLMSNIGFGQASAPSGGALLTNRAGNGLLNALSATSRTGDVISPTSIQRSQGPRSPVDEEEPRQKPPGFREDSIASHTSGNDAVGRNPLGAIGNDAPLSKAREEDRGQLPEIVDPLEGMSAIDRWGIKGHQTLMNNFMDYSVIAHGVEPAGLGLDLRSNEMISTQIYSLFNAAPPRPAIPKFKLPDCYEVKNVQPIEAKISSFNEETLMWIFYSCPRDFKQQLAAVELMNRNWRWHKRLQLWLTKDEQLVPQTISPNAERGYYIVWDKDLWRKERRELTLHYSDLDTTPTSSAVVA